MDQYYNQATARQSLERIIVERLAQGPADAQLNLYEQKSGAAGITSPVYIDRPTSWKLTKEIDDDGTHEEIVLRVQGIISLRNLPPISKPQHIGPGQQRHMRQSIRLTALGALYLQDCIKSIVAIQHTFSRLLPPDSMEDWVPAACDSHAAIDMGNRYFTHRHDTTDNESVTFNTSIDPDRILEKALGTDFVHISENDVKYFELISVGAENKYKTINPIRIRAGDIVEAQVSFVTIPLKGRRFKLLIVLRAITLLDCQPLKDANMVRVDNAFISRNIQPSAQIKLKRKVGYVDDAEENTRAKVAQMTLDTIHKA